jgi:hypothetical protein
LNEISDEQLFDEIADGTNLPFSEGVHVPDESDPNFPYEVSEMDLAPENLDDTIALNEGLLDWNEAIGASDCSSSSGILGRRDKTCPVDDRPLYEVRPLGRTKDRPLLPLDYEDQICLREFYGYQVSLMCDSGLPHDRHPTSDPDRFDLTNCVPCTNLSCWL